MVHLATPGPVYDLSIDKTLDNRGSLESVLSKTIGDISIDININKGKAMSTKKEKLLFQFMLNQECIPPVP
jgi:hypothetical protein